MQPATGDALNRARASAAEKYLGHPSALRAQWFSAALWLVAVRKQLQDVGVGGRLGNRQELTAGVDGVLSGVPSICAGAPLGSLGQKPCAALASQIRRAETAARCEDAVPLRCVSRWPAVPRDYRHIAAGHGFPAGRTDLASKAEVLSAIKIVAKKPGNNSLGRAAVP